MRKRRSLLLLAAGLLLLLGLAASAKDERPRGPAAEAVTVGGAPGEVRRPVGAPRGVALTVHGGGWRWSGGAALASQHPQVQRLLDAGFVAVNVDYAAGARSVGDVTRWLRWTANRFPRLPLCVAGESAGAHLALIAATRVDVPLRCAISWFGVLDFGGLRRSPVLEAKRLYTDAVVPFFAAAPALDPIRRAAPRLTAPTLLVSGVEDPVTPLAQAEAYARAAKAPVEVVRVPPGDVQSTHTALSADGLEAAATAERRLLDRVAAGRP